MQWDEPEESSETITATDDIGCVQVTMDPSSGRVVDFRLSALWRDKVGVAGFTDALASAVTRARLKYLEALTKKSRDRSAPTAPIIPADAWNRLSLEQQLDALGRLTRLLEAVTTEVIDVFRRRQTSTPVHYTGSDSRRKVSITLNGSGALAELAIDENWLEAASTPRVVSAITEAFESAYTSLDSCDELDNSMPTPTSDRVLALTTQPNALWRWLQLEDD